MLWEFTGELSFVVLENGEENDQWYRLNRVEVYKLCIDVLGFNWNADWF